MDGPTQKFHRPFPYQKSKIDYSIQITSPVSNVDSNHSPQILTINSPNSPSRPHSMPLSLSSQTKDQPNVLKFSEIFDFSKSLPKKPSIDRVVSFELSSSLKSSKQFLMKKNSSCLIDACSQISEKDWTRRNEIYIVEEGDEVSGVDSSRKILESAEIRGKEEKRDSIGECGFGELKGQYMETGPELCEKEKSNGFEERLETSKDEIFVSCGGGKIITKVRRSQTEILNFSFEEALKHYNKIPHIYIGEIVWIQSIFERCCCISSKCILSSELQDQCEKLIIFSYTEFNFSNIFHASLLHSIYKKLEILLEHNTDIVGLGFSCNVPQIKDLKHNTAVFGILSVLFLLDYFPCIVKKMIKYCRGCNIAFIPLAFDIAEITILTLRKMKLNEIMIKTQKCYETVFFFYAGCLSQWFVLYEKNLKDLGRVGWELEKLALKDPEEFMKIGGDMLKAQEECSY